MASRVLSNYMITEDDISAGDALLLQSCRQVEALYGTCVSHAHGLSSTGVYH